MAENKDSKTCYNVDTKHSKYVFVGDYITINVYPQKDREPQLLAVAPEEKEPLAIDTKKTSSEYDDPTQCIVLREEMDMNAGREESEIYEKSSVLEESEVKSHPAVFETTAVKPQADGEAQSNVVASEEEKPANTSKASPEYPRECIVAQKEMDMNAGREENEVHERSSVLESNPSAESETTVKSKGDSLKRRSLKLLRRLLPKKSPGINHEVQSEVQSKTNAACTGSLPSSKSVPTRREMCPGCIMADKTDLPQDRNKWPIAQIEKGCFQEICNLLDLYDLRKEPLLSALNCFTTKEVTLITQEFMATRGKGMASKALGIWGTSEDGNNVGALKDILKNTMKRVDVLEKIENWEKLSVCYGCGINI